METIILNVTTTDDQNDGNSADGLSLREAILTANANPTLEYVINLPAGQYDLEIKNTLEAPIVDVSSVDRDTLIESRLTTGDLDISGNITIIGEDPDNTIIDASNLVTEFQARLASLPVAPISGAPGDPIPTAAEFGLSTFRIADRVFDVNEGANLNLTNVTVTDGLLLANQEVILNVADGAEDIYSIVDLEGNVIEEIPLFGIISRNDIDQGGTISMGNFDTTPEGAGIQVNANATALLDNVVVENNSSETIAGGIYNEGDLTVNRSVIQENSSSEGTGIHNANNARVYNSLVANNFAGINALRTESGVERFVFPIGAGIFNQETGILTVANSTIYGNEGGVDLGGGLLTEGIATIINSTIVENTGQGGAGIWSNTSTANVTLYNSIVAQNKKPNFETEGDFLGVFYNVPDIDGFVSEDSSNNFLGYANGVLVDGVRGNIARTNISDTTQPIDIGLGDLQNNGGATPTVEIDGDSLFVDAGTNIIDNEEIQEINRFFPLSNLIDGKATDQRISQTLTPGENGTIIFRKGFERIANGTVDIGSYEFNAQEIEIEIKPSDPDDPESPPTNPDDPNQDIDRDNHPQQNGSGGDTGDNSNSGGENGTDTDNNGTGGDDNSNSGGENGNVDNDEDGMDIPDAPDQSDDNSEADPLAVLDMPLFRWQNNDRLGTFLFANEGESEQIANNPDLNFTNEGFAFRVGSDDADDLTAFYRFHNNAVPGTYLYANETERIDILANPDFSNFHEEGLAFYAYDGSADIAEDVYRLHNEDQQGTYLFVSETEKDQILANPNLNYHLEGVAFEASFSL